jgi:serine/threonine-protein kinase
MTEEESPMVAISSDARLLAATLAVEGSEQRIHVRSLDGLETRALAGTERGYNPFFSPDGRWLAFFADGKLKKTAVAGGPVVAVAEALDSRGGVWLPDDTILFAPGTSVGLVRVSAAGGAPVPVTTLDAERRERTHRWPHALPGGKAALFTVGAIDSPESYEEAAIDAVELATGRRVQVLEGASIARYLEPTGELLFGRGGTLFAVPFDAEALRTTGPPRPVLPGVLTAVDTGAVHFATADDGTLLYATGGSNTAPSRLAWQNRAGDIELLPLPTGNYESYSLSPDGRRIAVEVEGGRITEIWIYDLARGTSSRLTFDLNASYPLWMPDGERVVFVVLTPEGDRLLSQRADGSGEAEELLRTPHSGLFPSSFTPDGARVLFHVQVPGGQADLFSLPLAGERVPEPLAATPGDDGQGTFSPDGRFVAYASNESGRWEVYVRQLPGPVGRWQVTTGGGSEPRWSPDGRELFVKGPAGLEVVAVDTRAGFSSGPPRRLPGPPRWVSRSDVSYNVAPDGQRFLVLRPASEAASPTELVVVLGWAEEVRRLARPAAGS